MSAPAAPLADGADWNRFWSEQRKCSADQVSWSKRRILKVLAPYRASKKRVLDAGCGSGFFSEVFCGYGMTVTALDYSEKALALTRERTQNRAAIIQADMLTDPLAGRLKTSFDLIFTDGLFEHFTPAQQDTILKNFLSVLALGGKIITFVPNRWSPWELIRPWFMPGIDEKPFVLSQLRNLHVRNGMVLISDGGVNTLPVRFSPDRWLGRVFGMLLFVVAQKP
jgi:SAM-dependent methyltransferase